AFRYIDVQLDEHVALEVEDRRAPAHDDVRVALEIRAGLVVLDVQAEVRFRSHVTGELADLVRGQQKLTASGDEVRHIRYVDVHRGLVTPGVVAGEHRDHCVALATGRPDISSPRARCRTGRRADHPDVRRTGLRDTTGDRRGREDDFRGRDDT